MAAPSHQPLLNVLNKVLLHAFFFENIVFSPTQVTRKKKKPTPKRTEAAIDTYQSMDFFLYQESLMLY